MRLNTAWLLDYLAPGDTDLPAHADLVDAFTNIGLEVEEAIDLSAALRPVTLGKLVSVKPLDGAEGMHVTSVDVGQGDPLTIVVGSDHPLEEGWVVPVAIAPFDMPTGAKVREGKVRGVQSQGMLCLDAEMGLITDSSGLQHWDDDALIGKSLMDVSPTDQWLVELAILANRPDCLGVIGIARDVAAALKLTLTLPEIPPVDFVSATEGESLPIAIDNQAPDLCPRYLGQKLTNISVQQSPAWMRSRLVIAGSRPINNVVDITNFVLFEYGQPLHAFDFTTLAGPKIEIRKLRSGETLPLLDGSELTSDHEPLVIADAEKPVALAGIMGGTTTQTTSDTETLLLEAACFEPVQVRTAKKHAGIMTDSSYRFERGTDPNFMLSQAAARAIGLLSELAGAQTEGPVVESYPQVIEPQTVVLPVAQVQSLFGTDVESETIADALTRLGMTVETKEGGRDLAVTVPTYRVDVNDPVVLIEDVIRMVGYDQVPLSPMDGASTSGGRTALDTLKNRVAEALVAQGFFECRKAPLVDPAINAACTSDDVKAIQVSNPMRVDMAQQRTSLLPGLLLTADLNARRGEDDYRFFEVDRTFAQTDAGPEGRFCIGGVIGGRLVERNWQTTPTAVDFAVAKGVVESLLELMHSSDATFERATRPGFVKGETALIRSASGDLLGVLGRIDPGFVPKTLGVKLKTPLYGFELDLETLTGAASSIPQHSPLSRVPGVERDLAVRAEKQVTLAELIATFRASAGDVLKEVTCVDEYTGEQVGDSERVLTMRMLFRADDRTLTADEVQPLVDGIVEAIGKEHNATIRG